MFPLTPTEIVEVWHLHGQAVRQDQLDALLNRARIPVAALMNDPNEDGFAVRGASIELQEGNRFEFTEGEGEPAFILPARDRFGDVADIIAFRPGRDGFIASWFGAVPLLGAQNVALRLGEPLTIHPTVFDWLRDGRQGVVIVDVEHAASELLDAGPLLAAGGFEHAEKLVALLTPKPPRVLIPDLAMERRAA